MSFGLKQRPVSVCADAVRHRWRTGRMVRCFRFWPRGLVQWWVRSARMPPKSCSPAPISSSSTTRSHQQMFWASNSAIGLLSSPRFGPTDWKDRGRRGHSTSSWCRPIPGQSVAAAMSLCLRTWPAAMCSSGWRRVTRHRPRWQRLIGLVVAASARWSMCRLLSRRPWQRPLSRTCPSRCQVAPIYRSDHLRPPQLNVRRTDGLASTPTHVSSFRTSA